MRTLKVGLNTVVIDYKKSNCYIINLLLAMLNIITLPIARILTIAVFAICIGTYDYLKEDQQDRKF